MLGIYRQHTMKRSDLSWCNFHKLQSQWLPFLKFTIPLGNQTARLLFDLPLPEVGPGALTLAL